MIKRLVSLGSVIVDLVLEVPRLPDRGGDVLASQRGVAAGGAFNVLAGAGAAIAEHVAGLAPELTVVLDPGPLAADIETGRRASVMRRVDILTLNARELGALGGLNTVLGQVRPTATVILRQGPDGATI